MIVIRVPPRYSDFYPRPLRGGRQTINHLNIKAMIFLSTPSARRATHGNAAHADLRIDFYPRPLRGGRRVLIALQTAVADFYPRPLRGGRPRRTNLGRGAKNFYPRPLRGGRQPKPMNRHSGTRFLSTPSARRATAKTETKSLFSNKLYNILHEFRRALIYNGSKSYPNHAK